MHWHFVTEPSNRERNLIEFLHGIRCIQRKMDTENRNKMNAMPKWNDIQCKVNIYPISIEFQFNICVILGSKIEFELNWIELSNTEPICVYVTFVNNLFRQYASSLTFVWVILLRSAVRVQMLTHCCSIGIVSVVVANTFSSTI